MKKIFLTCRTFKVIFAPVLLISSALNAQSYKGVTNVRDTSYSTHSAYKHDVKTHPEIKIVPEFKFSSVKEQRNISYCEIGKRKLNLDVFYTTPKTNPKQTAVIIIHGGGWRTGSREQHYPMAQKLASLGYVCFTPEYRLSTEALFPAAIFDIKSAIRWVRSNASKYNVDENKIVVLGFSAGGEMASFMGTTANMPLFEGTLCNTDKESKVNAVVDIDGTLSFVHPDGREGDDSKSTSAATYWFGYSKKENPMLWQAASPLSYVSSKTPPTLFINSSVPWMHAGREDYIKVLDENGIYSEVKEFKDAPHSFCLYAPWFNPTIQYIDSFLKKVFSK
ncbi:alpha/beta hydrolase fold domain-containing protein [Flavobacterium sp. Sd200]|uniref:alpha/beta hydrolase n=1 Tax=Flavobacterium sp. Sd200 TaxID=2692211 RepID=UPI00136E0FC3|nr:alpha/beta hydrolase [Flavobacterium sp. Sd200]MXN92337.1 alpha/beta hydrolase fold domain-containing protein [Flavobacterium sp. Sd200]